MNNALLKEILYDPEMLSLAESATLSVLELFSQYNFNPISFMTLEFVSECSPKKQLWLLGVSEVIFVNKTIKKPRYFQRSKSVKGSKHDLRLIPQELDKGINADVEKQSFTVTSERKKTSEEVMFTSKVETFWSKKIEENIPRSQTFSLPRRREKKLKAFHEAKRKDYHFENSKNIGNEGTKKFLQDLLEISPIKKFGKQHYSPERTQKGPILFLLKKKSVSDIQRKNSWKFCSGDFCQFKKVVKSQEISGKMHYPISSILIDLGRINRFSPFVYPFLSNATGSPYNDATGLLKEIKELSKCPTKVGKANDFALNEELENITEIIGSNSQECKAVDVCSTCKNIYINIGRAVILFLTEIKEQGRI